MKEAFRLGTRVRTVGTPHVYGAFVKGPRHTRKYAAIDAHSGKVRAWVAENHPDPAKHWDL